MNCTEIRPLLSAYYDGEVTPEEHSTVERHLATCEDCRRVLAEYRAIGGGIRALPTPLPPVGLRRDIWRAIEAQQSPRAVSPASPGRNVTVLKPRERTHDTWGFPIIRPSGWGKALPAVAAIAAALVLFVTAILFVNRAPSTAAQLEELPPLSSYEQPVHIRFSQPVEPRSAEENTSVRPEGDAEPIEVEKRYDAAGKKLTISPKSPWQAGVRYDVYVDAPKVRLGVGDQTLAAQPIHLAFWTEPYTPTPTHTASVTPTATATPVPTDTPEPTRVADTPVPVEPSPVTQESPTAPPVPPSNTRVPHTATPTREPSNTAVPTRTATEEPTDTPEPKVTQTPTSTATVPTTATPRKGTPTPRTTATPKVTPTATPPCPIMPVSGFGKLWRENIEVRRGLGCPRADEIAIQRGAHQPFQGGYMFWRGDTRTIFVFLGTGNTGNWDSFEDTWEEGDPEPVETPPRGLYAPVRGFGKVWRDNPGLRQALGWATAPETGITGAWQPFALGNMLWTSDRVIRVIYDDGSWASYSDTYATPTPVVTPRRPGE